MTLYNGNNDTGPVFEKGYPRHEGYEEYMVRRMKEEEFTKYPVLPDIMDQIKNLEERVKSLETEIAYMKR